jgi:hypothetical protein
LVLPNSKTTKDSTLIWVSIVEARNLHDYQAFI